MDGKVEDGFREFVRESNRIEGILREPTDAELAEFIKLISKEQIGTADLDRLVGVYQPDAQLRRLRTQNVSVGLHVAPQGGPGIVAELSAIIERANANEDHPFFVHYDYEKLHPFTDGNGRSGRALWAWQMLRFNYWPGLRIGFLHCWYYQSLELSWKFSSVFDPRGDALLQARNGDDNG